MTPDPREADGMPNPERARALIRMSAMMDLRNRVAWGDAGRQWDELIGQMPPPQGAWEARVYKLVQTRLDAQLIPRCACGNLLTVIDRGRTCRQCQLAGGS